VKVFKAPKDEIRRDGRESFAYARRGYNERAQGVFTRNERHIGGTQGREGWGIMPAKTLFKLETTQAWFGKPSHLRKKGEGNSPRVH